MSRLLYHLSYPAAWMEPAPGLTRGHFHFRALMRNRTADLLLTMETLCLLSYEGKPKRNLTGHSATAQNEPCGANRVAR